MKLTSILITIAFTTGVVCNVLAQNTSPLPAGDTEIGNHFHAGQGNEVWSDASTLYFNFRGSAAATYFWNLGNTTGKSIMTLLNSGNVGIGTTTPASRLHISNSNAREALRVYLDGNTTNYLNMWQGSGGAAIDPIGTGLLYLGFDQGTNVVIGNNGGRLGIGTGSPSSKLTIDGIDNYSDGITIQNTTGYKHLITAFSDGVNPTTGSALQFKVANNNAGGNVAVMTLKGSGNVGIGTVSPGGALDVFKPVADGTTVTGVRVSESSGQATGRNTFEFYNGNQNYTKARLWSEVGGSYLATKFGIDVADAAKVIQTRMVIDVNGNVGIGTPSPDAKLAVSGQVHAQEVKVSVTVPGPDYVFEKDYKLTSLEEIKNYIDQNKHLPEVPSAKEMEKNGIQLGEMNMLLLKKIEELMLYVIELKKEVQELKENQQSKK